MPPAAVERVEEMLRELDLAGWPTGLNDGR